MLFYAKIGINIERETFFCQKDDNFSNNRLLPHFLRDSWLMLMSKGYLAVRGPRHIPFYASELIAKCLPITEACGVVTPSAWTRNILFILHKPVPVVTREFIKSLPKEIRSKIGYNIRRVQKGERDNELFKKLDGTEIWEFRTIYNKTCYRLFSFWDKDTNTLVVATHGIVKKSQKTPQKEITKADGLRRKYFENKNKEI